MHAASMIGWPRDVSKLELGAQPAVADAGVDASERASEGSVQRLGGGGILKGAEQVDGLGEVAAS